MRLIGDAVFTTPAIAALRRHLPTSSLSYLVEPAAEPVVRHNPHLSEVVVAERPRGWARVAYDVQLAQALRAKRFDLVIDFHGGPRSAWLTRASGAAVRIGYDLAWRRWAYTTRVPWRRALVPPRHSVVNQWDLLAPLGIAAPVPGHPSVEMPIDPPSAARVEQRLATASVTPSSQLIVLHVSAGNPFRRWPEAHFAQVAAALARADAERRIIITSGPSERVAADRVAEAARTDAGRAAAQVLRCGEFDLSELKALVERASLYIGGDSGPLHVAATTSVPIVALFGPTLPERSMPWRASSIPAVALDAGALPCRPCHQRHCVPGDFRCLTSIAPDQVIAAAERLLRAAPVTRTTT